MKNNHKMAGTGNDNIGSEIFDVSTQEQERIKMPEDPYSKAISYLEKHNILQLFQHLTTDVIYNKPSDPLEYLIKEVQQMKEKRNEGKSSS